MDTKVCKVCGKEKPISDFYISWTTRDGRVSVCKECMRSRWKNNSKYDKDYYMRKYRENNMFVPLARVAYNALLKKYGKVDYEIVKKYTHCTQKQVENAVKYFEGENENILEEI